MENEVVIRGSKSNTLLLLLGSLGFIGLSIFYLIYMGPFADEVVYGVYALGIAFFGFCAFIAGKKLLGGAGGVVVNDKGIGFYSYNLEPVFIQWGEIDKIEEYSIMDQKFVNVFIKFPDFYINKQKTGFIRGLMKLNNNLAGTPIQISANTLTITHEELLKALQDKFKRSKSSSIAFQ